MKRFLSFLLCLIFLIASLESISVSALTEPDYTEPTLNLTRISECKGLQSVHSQDSRSNTDALILKLFSKTNDKKITSIASDYLDTIKEQFKSDSLILGISKEELTGAKLGDSFTIQVYDDLGKDVSSDQTVSYPVIYNNKIIGILELFYDSKTDQYGYTFGKSYADELNSLKGNNTFSDDSELSVVFFENKLIATDGTNKALIKEFDVDFEDPTGSACCQSEADNFAIRSTSSYLNPLPVPHVAQTGVCGIAAWAAVLNFRYGTTYTNNSLATAMSYGYCHGTDGIPNMTDYKNFANDMFNAGCTVGYNPPSFTTVKNCINNGKPIMGSWYSGSGSSKVYHAIIITGYVENIFNFTYTVKNPWYNYTQTIYVPDSSNVVYVNAGVYWYLLQTVY